MSCIYMAKAEAIGRSISRKFHSSGVYAKTNRLLARVRDKGSPLMMFPEASTSGLSPTIILTSYSFLVIPLSSQNAKIQSRPSLHDDISSILVNLQPTQSPSTSGRTKPCRPSHSRRTSQDTWLDTAGSTQLLGRPKSHRM